MNNGFWNLVKRLIKEKNMTQSDFSKSIGINVRTFQDWIYSNKLPDIISAKKISKVLNISLDNLLAETEQDNQTENNSVQFYKRCEELAKEKNLTLNELGALVGISGAAINGWKNGSLPRVDIAIKVASVLEVPVEYLVMGCTGSITKLSIQELMLLSNFRKLPDFLKDFTVNQVSLYMTFPALLSYENTLEEISLNNVNDVYNEYSGYCYIGVDANWEGYYKIGRTKDPSCKTRQSATINPNYKIIYRTKELLENAKTAEDEIHSTLVNNRLQDNNCTEWFKLSESEVNELIEKYNFVKLKELENI